MPEPIHIAEINALFRTQPECDGPVGAFSVVDWRSGDGRYQIINQGQPGDDFMGLSAALREAEALAVAFDVNRLVNGGLRDSELTEIFNDLDLDVVKGQITPLGLNMALKDGGVVNAAEAETVVRMFLDKPDTAVLGLSRREYDAALAGLRLLARELEAGRVSPDDNDIGAILTCGLDHPGLTSKQIHSLADAWQAGERDIAR